MRCIWVILFLLSVKVNAQFLDFRKEPYNWDTVELVDFPLRDEYKRTPAVILNESQQMDMRMMNPALIRTYINRTIRVRYNDQKGIDEYSFFQLPESPDPLYHQTFRPYEHFYKPQAAPWLDSRVTYFSAAKLTDSGFVEIDVRVNIDQRHLRSSDITTRLDTYGFQLLGLEPGDEVEIRYGVEVPYAKNWFHFNSGRIFLDRAVPAQDLTFVFRHNSKMTASFGGVEPTETHDLDGQTELVWKQTDLPGTMREPNARQHLHVPYIEYLLNQNNNEFITLHALSRTPMQMSYWMHVLRYREKSAPGLYRLSRKKIMIDKQSRKVHEFIDEASRKIPDSLRVLKMLTIHNEIAREFEYQDDWAYFSDRDLGRERVGNFTESKILREISRYNLYVRILFKLKLPFYTYYTIDKRYGLINRTFESSLMFDPQYFLLPAPKGFHYLFPKLRDGGYLTDEIPFFHEGGTGILGTIYELFSNRFIPEIHLLETPVTPANLNHRRVSVNVDGNIFSDAASYSAIVQLSGQYSTMCRHAYSLGETDSTVAPVYAETIWKERSSSVKIEEDLSDTYPFVYRGELSGKQSLEPFLKEDTVFLDGRDVVHLLVTPIKNDRKLPYYLDFAGDDEFNYQFNIPDGYNPLMIHEQFIGEHWKGSISLKEVEGDKVLLTISMSADQEKIDGQGLAELTGFTNYLARLEENGIPLFVRKG